MSPGGKGRRCLREKGGGRTGGEGALSSLRPTDRCREDRIEGKAAETTTRMTGLTRRGRVGWGEVGEDRGKPFAGWGE